jgi:hypothetical protein
LPPDELIRSLKRPCAGKKNSRNRKSESRRATADKLSSAAIARAVRLYKEADNDIS